MTSAEKILTLLSLCDNWSWNRPIIRSIDAEGTQIDHTHPIAIVNLWYNNRHARFSYGHGLTEQQKYRRLLRAVHRLDLPLPDFGYEDLAVFAVR